MNRRIRSLTFTIRVASSITLAGSIGGCISAPGREERTPVLPASLNKTALRGDLQVWSWNIAAKALMGLIPEFNRRYPNVHVKVDMNGTNMQSRLLLSLSAGVGAPDVSQLQLTDAQRYIATGRLADLTLVAAEYERMFPASRWKNCARNGRVYAIPWDIGPCAVYYKRAIFRKYGIDPERIETWDDFIAAGKTIVERSHGQTKMFAMGAGTTASQPLTSMLEILLQQAGGQIFDDQGRVAIDSPASYQALGVIKRMLDAGICRNVPWWSQEWMAGLKDDSIATYPLAVWFGATIKDTVKDFAGEKPEWGVFRLPALEKGGLRNSNLGGSVLVIPAQCRQKEAAWAFIEYALCTRESQVAQFRHMDLFPAFLPALNDPYFDEPVPFFEGQKTNRLFATDVARVPALNRTEDWSETQRYLDQSLSSWSAGDRRSDGFFSALARKLQRKLGRPIVSTRNVTGQHGNYGRIGP